MKRTRAKSHRHRVSPTAGLPPFPSFTFVILIIMRISLDIFFFLSEANSLLDYVRSELRRGYELQNDEQRYKERRDKLYISMWIPVKLENVKNKYMVSFILTFPHFSLQFLVFGFFQCVDAFLFVLTFLPFRFLLALILLLVRTFKAFIRYVLGYSWKFPLLMNSPNI